MNRKQKKLLVRIIISAVFLIALRFVHLNPYIMFALYLADYLIIAYDVLIKAGRGIIRGRVFDELFLMAVASVGAFSLAVYSKSGDYVEAVAVMVFYQLGQLFESYAVGKSRKNISALMDIRPDYANVEIDGKITQLSPDDIEPGTVIIVRPGEKIPIDGVVIEGSSSLDTAALTGESVPSQVYGGDEVMSGCINIDGLLRIRTTKEFGESTVSKILELVENSSSRKSKSENFISRFARFYTPAVCALALTLAVGVPLFRMLILKSAPSWSDWIYRALTFLVISCPCALVISVPLSFFAGLGGASREGILIKGSNYLETLSKTKTVVFDKTGTLTEGSFSVNKVYARDGDDEKLIETAALAESSSSHPISRSIIEKYGRDIDLSRVSGVREIRGKGVTAEVDGKTVCAGNGALMDELGVKYTEAPENGTVVYVAVNSGFLGYIVISDTIKKTSAKAIKALKESGIKTVMLTGDSEAAAKPVCEALSIDEHVSRLLPAEKVAKTEEIIRSTAKGKTAFAGDGINDAPVLSAADIGIAMGALGSDAAIEAADVVLMDDDPLKISKAIKISRKCLRIVYQNIIIALGVKFACLILGAAGIANMWLAVFADVGVMIIAVLNAVRALNVKKL